MISYIRHHRSCEAEYHNSAGSPYRIQPRVQRMNGVAADILARYSLKLDFANEHTSHQSITIIVLH